MINAKAKDGGLITLIKKLTFHLILFYFFFLELFWLVCQWKLYLGLFITYRYNTDDELNGVFNTSLAFLNCMHTSIVLSQDAIAIQVTSGVRSAWSPDFGWALAGSWAD